MSNKPLIFIVMTITFALVLSMTCTNALVLQSLFTMVIFGIPAILYALYTENAISALYLNKTPSRMQLLLLLGFMLFIFPAGNFLSELNWIIPLPEIMETIETKLRISHIEAQQRVENILREADISLLGVYVLSLAVVPAIFEEIFFRGFLQGWLTKKINYHIAIVGVSIIFSLLHFDFYGSIPRLCISVLYGYIFYYTGSLWSTILAHFVNNSLYVIIIYTQMNTDYLSDIDTLGGDGTMWIGGIFSIMAITSILLMKYDKTKRI